MTMGRRAQPTGRQRGRRLVAFAGLLIKDGALSPDYEDEILKGALVTQGGAVVHEGLKG